MSGCCNNTHVSMDDTFIQWNEILGDPSKSTSLVEFTNQQIQRAIDDSISDLINAKMETAIAELKEEIAEEIEQITLEIDPYKINYKDTTVGDTLDSLTKTGFSIEIQEFPVYEKGQNFPSFTVNWTISENPRSLAVLRIRDNARIEKHVLDPSARSFTFANVSCTETFKVVGTNQADEMFEASSTAEFKYRMYYGTNANTSPTSSVVTSWASVLVDKDSKIGTRIFDCEGGNYIYFAFPDELSPAYDFFANGLRDNNWVYEVLNITNSYGYVHPYRVYRTGNLLNGNNIYVEVKSHDWY